MTVTTPDFTALPLLGRVADVEAAREKRYVTWRAALEAAGGNISRAAREMEVSRSQATLWTKIFELKEFARELRRASGFRGKAAMGRPPNQG